MPSLPKRPVNQHKAYHAHIYFDEETKNPAKALCSKVKATFALRVGTFLERLVGPHPMWSCQITFGEKDFDDFVPWLDKNREGLTVFIHGLTGDNLKDHTDYAYWLGEAVTLNLDFFNEQET